MRVKRFAALLLALTLALGMTVTAWATASATVGNVTINGKVGFEINGTATITLTDETVVAGGINVSDASGWFDTPSLPADVTASAVGTEGETSIIITFGGTPTAVSTYQFSIKIPDTLLTTTSGSPLTVTPNPDAKFAIIPSATVADITVDGKVDSAITGTPTADITLNGDTIGTALTDYDVSSWVTNLPTGMTALATGDDAAFSIEFGGTPSAISSEPFVIVIPASALDGTNAITVETNANAKFNIIGADRTVTFNSNGGSAVAGKTVTDGNTFTAPATPTRPGYSFVGWYKESGLQNAWNFSTDTVTSNITLYAKWSVIPVDDDDDDSSSGGSSGGGGGGSSSGSNIPSTVTPAAAASAVNDAVQQAAASGSDTATARIFNPGDVSLDTLKSMQNPDVNVLLNADNLNPSGTGVEVRISLDPSQSTKDLDLSASTSDSNARNTNEVFQSYFQNNTNTVSFGQQGDFGQSVRVAVKPDPDLNTDNLYFYAYDKETNTYSQISNADYFVDANGYVHFTTSVGGSIIMSDGPLTKK